jgi:hypothetical protein
MHVESITWKTRHVRHEIRFEIAHRISPAFTECTLAPTVPTSPALDDPATLRSSRVSLAALLRSISLRSDRLHHLSPGLGVYCTIHLASLQDSIRIIAQTPILFVVSAV